MKPILLNKALFLIALAYFLVAVQPVMATYISPGKIVIHFEPFFEETYIFRVGAAGSGKIEVNVAGDLAKYAKIGKITRYPNGDMEFPVHIKLPERIDTPGHNKIKVSAREITTEGGGQGFNVKVNVIAPITIIVPYPGIYIQSGFEVRNINVNETADFRFVISSLGYQNVTGAYAQVDVYSSENNFNNRILTLYSEPQTIWGNQRQEIHIPFNSTGYKPGKYKVIGTLYYTQNKTMYETYFNIGTLIVHVFNYTKNFQKDTINKFDIEIESGWNNLIENVYGIVIVNESLFQTPSVSLNPFERKTITGYWDTTGLDYGEYPVTIKLYYHGRMNAEYGTVWIPEPPKKKWYEQPLSFTFNTTTLLAIVIILLVLVDVWWVIIRKKEKKQQKKRER
jgi:hypothetical protein